MSTQTEVQGSPNNAALRALDRGADPPEKKTGDKRKAGEKGLTRLEAVSTALTAKFLVKKKERKRSNERGGRARSHRPQAERQKPNSSKPSGW